jgi:hypothetical protein
MTKLVKISPRNDVYDVVEVDVDGGGKNTKVIKKDLTFEKALFVCFEALQDRLVEIELAVKNHTHMGAGPAQINEGP